MLYDEVLDLWIEEKKKEVRESSSSSYEYTMNHHIKPKFGFFEVCEISREMIQEYIYELMTGLKRETVLHITKILSQSFDYAHENHWINDSPWRKIKIPQDTEEHILNTFSTEEINTILYSGKADQTKRDIVNIAYRTGMRIGEILTLKWSDINMDLYFLTVNRTLSGYSKGNGHRICAPKTKKSRRRIDLDLPTMEMLRRRLKDATYDFVFCKADGDIFSRQMINQAFKRMCIAASVEYRTFHVLRHTHASILLAAGVHPKIVQDRLGHSSITITLDRYSHIIPGMQQIAVAVFNQL